MGYYCNEGRKWSGNDNKPNSGCRKLGAPCINYIEGYFGNMKNSSRTYEGWSCGSYIPDDDDTMIDIEMDMLRESALNRVIKKTINESQLLLEDKKPCDGSYRDRGWNTDCERCCEDVSDYEETFGEGSWRYGKECGNGKKAGGCYTYNVRGNDYEDIEMDYINEHVECKEDSDCGGSRYMCSRGKCQDKPPGPSGPSGHPCVDIHGNIKWCRYSKDGRFISVYSDEEYLR